MGHSSARGPGRACSDTRGGGVAFSALGSGTCSGTGGDMSSGTCSAAWAWETYDCTGSAHDGALVGVADSNCYGIAKRSKNEIGEYIHINLESRRSLIFSGLETHILVYIY